MTQAIIDHVFPGAVLLVGRLGTVLFREAYGVANRFTNRAVTLETVFDLASLTKPLATTLAVLSLVQEGRLTLETSLGEVLPEVKGTPKQAIEIRHLLYHASGLPAHRHYYRLLTLIPVEERKAALRALLVEEPLLRSIGSAVEYSDLGFMLLGWVIEQVTQERLDRFVNRKIFSPLGLNSFGFRDTTQESTNSLFAATELCPWRGVLLVGAVSDDNAWATGGFDGHAGLFGTGDDVYGLLKVLLSAYHGEAARVFDPPLVQLFLSRHPVYHRALGFDTPAAKGSSCGRLFSGNTVGHLGFTGTSFWVDLERKIVVILLSNRVHPDRENPRIKAFRPVLHDLVMETVLSIALAADGK